MRSRKKCILLVFLIILLHCNQIFAITGYDLFLRYNTSATELSKFKINALVKFRDAIAEMAEKYKVAVVELGTDDIEYTIDVSRQERLFNSEGNALDSQGETIKNMYNTLKVNFRNENLVKDYEKKVKVFISKWENATNNLKNGRWVKKGTGTKAKSINGNKKGIGHENVGAKIWTPGDNVNDILNNNAGGPINDPGNPLQTSVVNGDTDTMIIRDFGNGWGFTAPKTFEVDNGIIYFIDAKQSVNRSDDGNEEYMEVTYKAVINDGRGESLHFNFVNNNEKSIVENVGTYDYNFTTKISRKGKYIVSK